MTTKSWTEQRTERLLIDIESWEARLEALALDRDRAGGYGNTVNVGFSIFEVDCDTGAVITDEDGEHFPNLETAIRCHAEHFLKFDWQWTGWQDSPPLHRSAGDGKATEVAFSQRDISFAAKLASGDLNERERTPPDVRA